MILICDDDPTIRSSLTLVLKRAGYDTAAAATPDEAVNVVRHTTPRLILMDMNYSKSTTGEEGLELLAKVKIFCPDVPVILITAWGSIDLAVRGVRAGAFNFITKPWNNLALLSHIETAIKLSRRSDSLDTAQGELNGEAGATGTTASDGVKKFRREKIIGKSPLLTRIFETLQRVAHTNAPVLITGESGTGKELIAEALHANSERSKSPFVKVNLGGISQSLFESEMFGHKKGAFTDAQHDRVGRFEMADKGSIFLDEIGELDITSQVKLLRVLQDQTFESLGDSRQKQVDTRVISATNRNLTEMVRHGAFREDLFYRINLITVQMPALRERTDDIPALVAHFIHLQRKLGAIEAVEVSAEAFDFLRKLPYPGNIRELKNLVDRTLLVSGKEVLTAADFREQYVEAPAVEGSSDLSVRPLDNAEQAMIRRAVDLYGNNHSKIAAALGLSRQTLYRRLEKYGIKV